MPRVLFFAVHRLRTLGRWPFLSARTWPFLTLLCIFCLNATACGRGAEFDAVREYKVFLEEAKPSLVAMNKAREELFQLDSPDKMLPLFKDKLLPLVDKLSKLAADQKKPDGKLGDIHANLAATLSAYAKATHDLVDKLADDKKGAAEKSAAAKSDDQEKAVVNWGVSDQKFGKSMTQLVNDLTEYLDRLKK